MKHFDIYTDCAGSVDEFGISFVVFEGEDEKIYKFKVNTESLNKEFGVGNKVSNISIGECYAVSKALQFLKNEKEFSARIYTDNNHVFMLLNKQCKIKRNHKRKFGNLLSCIVGRCKQLNPHPRSIRRNIEIRLINGHIGIYGNEIANIAAQHAKKRKEIDVSKRGYKFNDFESYKSDGISVIQKFKRLS